MRRNKFVGHRARADYVHAAVEGVTLSEDEFKVFKDDFARVLADALCLHLFDLAV